MRKSNGLRISAWLAWMALIDAQSNSQAAYGVRGVQNGRIQSEALMLVLLNDHGKIATTYIPAIRRMQVCVLVHAPAGALASCPSPFFVY